MRHGGAIYCCNGAALGSGRYGVKLNRDDEPVVLTDMRPLSVPRLVRGEQRADKLRFIAQLLFALAGWVFIYAWLS
jgi:hypothetical protein